MHILIILLTLLNINYSYGRININKNKVPVEFQYLIDHIEKNETATKKINLIIEELKMINKDLSSLPKEATLFLLKAEIYKGILNYHKNRDNNSIFLNTIYLERTESKLKLNAAAYSHFDQWLMKSIISDYQPFRDDKFIDNLESASKGSSTSRRRYREYKQIHKFNSYWLDRFEKLSTVKFNHLITKVGKKVISSLATKSYLFSLQYKNLGGLKKEDLFMLPFKIEEPVVDEANKNETVQTKKTSEELVEIISPEDLSPASSEIDKIDTTDSKEDDAWKPE